MADRFTLLYFTAPEAQVLTQAVRINTALSSGGFDFAHIRMPHATRDDVKAVIDAVEPGLRQRLTLHDHFDLAEESGVGGVHLNRRNPEPPKGWTGRVSRSCHNEDEALTWSEKCDYVTLSPIFPSISKPGYKADFSTLRITRPGIIALGGVNAVRLRQVRAMGFGGAAVLGWLDVDFPDFCRRVKQIKMLSEEKFSLQYITNGIKPDEVANEVAAVIAGGCRWVQIRMKDAPDSDVIAAAGKVMPMCRKAGAICLLDDRVHLVERTGADGVHLGKNDMPPDEAAGFLGATRIIGSTANSLEDIRHILEKGATDYIGCGPFRFTTTKKNLAPVLGLDGYNKIFSTAEGQELPIVAIGGIEINDIGGIINAGASGVAVSGCIYRAPDREKATKEIIRVLHVALAKNGKYDR